MATRDTGQPAQGITRRDFLKATAAATAVAGCGLEFAYDPEKASAYENSANHTVTFTTCPYCSAQCGQRVVVDKASGQVVDIYGDFESPINSGGLCAKGAGALQLVNNPRRIGAWESDTHPTGHNAFTAKPATAPFAASSSIPGWAAAGLTAYSTGYTYADGVAYFRRGNDEWAPVPLPEAMKAAATRLKAARDTSFKTTSTVDAVLTATEASPKVMTVSVDGVDESRTYYGFGGLSVVARVDGKFKVAINGTKLTSAALGALLLDPVANAAALVDAFDMLVWDGVSSPSKATEYGTIKPKVADLGSVLFAAGVMGNNADIIRDSAVYRAYVCDPVGALHEASSPDMVTWTYGAAIPFDATFTAVLSGLKNLSVSKSGSKLTLYANGFVAGVESSKVYYVTATKGASWSWTAPVAVTFGGLAQDPGVHYNHPFATSNGATTTLYVNHGGGSPIAVAEAPFHAPTAFTALKPVVTPVRSHGNVVAAATYAMFTQYQAGFDSTLGWAYADVYAYNAAIYNSKAVAFFGSSHMNNESNYMYRKLIANFGTSNVEHQARI